MGKFKDLSGRKFGELTVIKDDGMRQGNRILWLCKCSCGNLVRVTGANLVYGETVSCGHVGIESLKAYRARVKRETPGTRLDLLTNAPSKNNKTGYRNISFSYYRGEVRYRVTVMYQRKQYGSSRKTLAEAIELREKLRYEHWPNYQGLDTSASKTKTSDTLETTVSAEKRRRSKFVPDSDSEIETNIFDISTRYRSGKHYWVGIEGKRGLSRIGIYDTLAKARINRDKALAGKPVDASSKFHQASYVEPGIKLTPSGRYQAQIYTHNKTTIVGTYDTVAQARDNIERAKKRLPTDPTIKRHR